MLDLVGDQDRPYREAGVPGWLVRCPRRGDIAAMRCGQYQERDSCGGGCDRKAGVGTLVALASMRDSFAIQQENLRIAQQAFKRQEQDEDDDDLFA